MSSDPLLQAAIRAVAHGGDADAALAELLEIALRIAGADRAATFLWDADRGRLALAGARGIAPDDVPAFEAAASAEGHPVQLAAHERLRTTASTGERVVSAWPIVLGRDGIEEPVGALALEGADVGDDEQGDRVAAIADLVAITVDWNRMASETGERADWAERIRNSDLLTGLANARTLARVIELEIARAARQQSGLTIAMFDVDNLTVINEAAGRAAGDDVLREVAAVIAESVRLVDTVARWGGDEFMLVAPGATGTTVVRRIVESVAGRPPIAERRYTVSAGIAQFPADGTTGDELIASAQSALRAAQAAGPGTLAAATHDGNGSTSGITTRASGA